MPRRATLPPFPPHAIVHAHAAQRAGAVRPIPVAASPNLAWLPLPLPRPALPEVRPSNLAPVAAPPAAPTVPALPAHTPETALSTRIDALAEESRATGRVLELLVAQMVQVTDTVGALTQRLVELNTLPGLAPRSPPPLVPAFEQAPLSPPLANPSTRAMEEWEKLALTKLLRSGRLSRSQRNGVAALLEPELTHEVLADADDRVYTFDLYEYDDYRLWKLWHYLVGGVAIEEVLTEEERRALTLHAARGGRADRGRPPSQASVAKKRARPRHERDAVRAAAEAGASLDTTRAQHLVGLGQKAEQAVLRLAEEGMASAASGASGASGAPPQAAH